MSVYDELSTYELVELASNRGIEMVDVLMISCYEDKLRPILIDLLNGTKELIMFSPMADKEPRPPRKYFITGVVDGMLYAIPKTS